MLRNLTKAINKLVVKLMIILQLYIFDIEKILRFLKKESHKYQS